MPQVGCLQAADRAFLHGCSFLSFCCHFCHLMLYQQESCGLCSVPDASPSGGSRLPEEDDVIELLGNSEAKILWISIHQLNHSIWDLWSCSWNRWEGSFHDKPNCVAPKLDDLVCDQLRKKGKDPQFSAERAVCSVQQQLLDVSQDHSHIYGVTLWIQRSICSTEPWYYWGISPTMYSWDVATAIGLTYRWHWKSLLVRKTSVWSRLPQEYLQEPGIKEGNW